MNERERHPADVLRFVLGAAIVVATAFLAYNNDVGSFEIDLFHAINDLSEGFKWPLVIVMQLGTLNAAAVVVLVALAFRRYWLALAVGLAAVLADVSAHVLRSVVARPRPLDVLGHVVVRGHPVTGNGFPSGHPAIAAAIVTAASPYLPRRVRRLGWLAVVLVAFARVYVGAHFPLDVVAGIALGWSAGALVSLALGTPL